MIRKKQTLPNHYKTLGVLRSADMEQIKLAFYRIARKKHPDLKRGDLVQFTEVTEAYGALKTPARRKEYDVKLTACYGDCTPCKGTGITKKARGFTEKEIMICNVCKGYGIKA